MSETRGSDVDDPREILRAAGVECAEVEALLEFMPDVAHLPCESEAAGHLLVLLPPAILALARRVAKFKWMATHETGRNIHAEMCDIDRDAEQVAALDRRWADRHA